MLVFESCKRIVVAVAGAGAEHGLGSGVKPQLPRCHSPKFGPNFFTGLRQHSFHFRTIANDCHLLDKCDYIVTLMHDLSGSEGCVRRVWRQV